MLYIKRNSENKIVVTVSQHKTLSNPYYLFSFEHILSKDKTRFYPKNISTSTERYDEFVFFEGDEPVGYTGDTPYIKFAHEGQHYYGVYEMFSTATTDPSYAFDKLEEGRAFVENDADPAYFTTWTSNNENNANFVYYGEDYNRDFVTFNVRYQSINDEQTIYNFRDEYPPLTIYNGYTNDTSKLTFTMSDDNICDYPTIATSETTTLAFNTGTTGYIDYYYDDVDLTAYGYGYTDSPYITKRRLSEFYYDYSVSFWYYKETIFLSTGAPVGPINRPITDISEVYDLLTLTKISGATECVIPSPTPSPTPSVTPSITRTPTVTPTATITPSVTTTPSVTPSITITPSVTLTPTPSSTPIPPNYLLAENSDELLAENGDNLEPEYYPNQITITWEIDFSGASGTYDYYTDGYVLNEDYSTIITGAAPNGNTYKIYRRDRGIYPTLYIMFREDTIGPFYSNNFLIIDITTSPTYPNGNAANIYDYSTGQNAIGNPDTYDKWFMKEGVYLDAGFSPETDRDITITYN